MSGGVTNSYSDEETGRFFDDGVLGESVSDVLGGGVKITFGVPNSSSDDSCWVSGVLGSSGSDSESNSVVSESSKKPLQVLRGLVGVKKVVGKYSGDWEGKYSGDCEGKYSGDCEGKHCKHSGDCGGVSVSSKD